MRVSGRARERERAELKMRLVSDHPGVERQVSTPSSHVVSLHLTPSLSPEAGDALMCGRALASFTTKIRSLLQEDAEDRVIAWF